MKFWTHPDYHNNKVRNELSNANDISLEVIHGKFKIRYVGYNNQEYFGVFSWKTGTLKNPCVEFYENDLLLFTKDIIRPREFHFVVGGDGETRANTYYLWFGKNYQGQSCGKVSDFNDQHIRDVSLGPDCYTGTISLNENYFVSLTEEMCTNSRFFGLIDKRIFFAKEHKQCWDGNLSIPAEHLDLNKTVEEIVAESKELVQNLNLPKPYNDARIGLCVDWHDQCGECMEPIEATNDGLIFADVTYQDNYKVKSYTKTQLVLYDDVANYDQNC